MVEVARRDAATLLPLIAAHVRPRSIVYSDEWSAYNQIADTVNHSLHFVDLSAGRTARAKRMMRRRFGGPVAFGKIITHIAEQYPCISQYLVY